MKNLFLLILMLLSLKSFAEIKEFSSGEVIKAEDLNNNFSYIIKREFVKQTASLSFNTNWVKVPGVEKTITVDKDSYLDLTISGSINASASGHHCNLRYYLNNQPMFGDSHSDYGELIQMGQDDQHWNTIGDIQRRNISAGTYTIDVRARDANGSGECSLPSNSYGRLRMLIEISPQG